MIEPEEALWAAKLHVKTSVGGTPGTLLTTDMVLAVCEELVFLDASKCQQNHLHPDWSLLEASRTSLRESWKRVKALRAALEREVLKLSADRSWCTICRTEHLGPRDENFVHPHAPSCALGAEPAEPLAYAASSPLQAICTCAASRDRLPHQRDDHCLYFTDGIKVTP